MEYQHVAFPTLTPSTSRGNFTNSGIYTPIVANKDASTDRAQFVLAPLTPQSGTLQGLGGSNTVSASSYSPIFNLVRQYLGAYVQDSWKATPNLTLNYGLRWEFLGVPTESDGRFANFVPAQTGDTKGNVSRFYIPEKQVSNVPVAFQILLASNDIAFTPISENALGYAQKGNFAPRIGFSFQASPKLVLRGGYGLFYQGYENHGLSISPWVNYPFQITSSYTAGSSVALVTADNSVGPLCNGLQNARDLLDNGVRGYRAPYVQGYGINADYAPCDIDVRRIVHASGSYELPFGRNKALLQHGIASALAGGWSTNFILTAQDGQPLSVACSTTTAAGQGCFALKVPGQPLYTTTNRVVQFLNPAAFANPATGSLGGPPAQVFGPAFRRFDFSLFRRFALGEARYFEFRAETFNLTNTPNFAQPGNLNFTSPATFAQISSTRSNPNDPRQIQFSLKFYY